MSHDHPGDYRRQIESAIRATSFHSATSYSWLGTRSPQPPAALRRALTPATARSYLLYQLRTQLYRDFYAPGVAAQPRSEAIESTTGRQTLVGALSTANSGRGSWQAGWEVRAVADDEVLVSRDGITLRAQPDECLMPEDGPLAAGTAVSVRRPKELLADAPGYYTALGDVPFDQPDQAGQPDDGALVRLYWHLRPEGAVAFVSAATRLLNDAQRAFSLKVLSDPDAFVRSDAAVIYLLRRDFPVLADVLARLYTEMAPDLRPRVPAFTKRIAPGLALAEGYRDGASFGMHRCGLLADGLIHAYEQGARTVAGRLRVVEARFSADGISLDAPFLNSSSNHTYDSGLREMLTGRDGLQAASPVPRPFMAGMPPSPTMPQPSVVRTDATAARHADYVAVAAEIGRRFAREAIWHDGRCTWVGGVPERPPAPLDTGGSIDTTPGPDIYTGTAGIALFLAELYVSTNDPDHGRLALGAMRQALARARAHDGLARLGLYCGRMGVALAAAWVGQCLGEDELRQQAADLVRATLAAGAGPAEDEFDLIYGIAGAIVALLALQSILADASPDIPLIEQAARLGDDLLQRAEVSGGGYSWRALHFRTMRNLTGLSHGAAGAGYALLELWRATGETRFRDAAEQAFAYERHWFDPVAGNWPDFRPHAIAPRRGSRACDVKWCHGAPGIGLTRLRAYSLLRDDMYRAEAVEALRTTRTAIEAALLAGEGNYSLCHGLAGNAEILGFGAAVVTEEASGWLDLVYAVADAGVRTYAARGAQWPCGVPVGETPGLMRGLAGIGYFYLRLSDPAIPSILLMQPEHFSAPRRPPVKSAMEAPGHDAVC